MATEKAPPVRFVLVQARNSLNIGAAARAIANFGFRDLVAVEPYEKRWREAVSAAEAAEVLRRARLMSLEEAVADCSLVLGTASAHNRTVRRPHVPVTAARAYIARRLPKGGRAAILFGSEKTGLRNEDLRYCHALLQIPTDPEFPSMNLGQAVAVTAYELTRPGLRREVRDIDEPPPVSRQISLLVEASLAALERARYNQHMSESTRRDLLRRMYLRWRMTRGDAAFLQALFKRLA